MYLVRPYILKDLNTRNLIWRIPGNEKVIYLTFDDGPIPELTPFVLETLEKCNAKATFFCVGDNVRKYPELFEAIVEAGHSVGNHTFNHFDGWKKNAGEYEQNVSKSADLIGSNLFRPPYGHITPWQITRLKSRFFIILWTVLSGDYDRNTTPARCLRNVIRFTKRGSIVVFHDNKKALPRLKYTLPRYIEYYTKQGYRFEALTDDVLERALRHNWLNASGNFVNRVIGNVKIPISIPRELRRNA
ncbi:MAG: polysaccharide deacetylase family protein [Bacteroidetes bacterium HGW-Bacteroidetes-6]|jgi:peptidoglycan/xylan/chitin deacetylase (PgdA/CDA1 family)|nr:MAG: polysaccharide deacetylase family protein [Bacteroidetes bacterium HGW-Bacteroidetes-6]